MKHIPLLFHNKSNRLCRTLFEYKVFRIQDTDKHIVPLCVPLSK